MGLFHNKCGCLQASTTKLFGDFQPLFVSALQLEAIKQILKKHLCQKVWRIFLNFLSSSELDKGHIAMRHRFEDKSKTENACM